MARKRAKRKGTAAQRHKARRSGRRKAGSQLAAGLIVSRTWTVARWVGAGILLLLGASVVWVFIYRFMAPPSTFLIASTRWSGVHVSRVWVPIEAVAPDLWRTVIGAEDSRFCSHVGFDLKAVDQALEEAEKGRRLRGASTISQQTAKNAFLWPGRSWVRKGFEAYFTVLMEAFWPKRRIMEVYLNIAEFGHGIFGAEAAAQRFFGVHARDLTAHQAALLAAVLPNPHRMHAGAPSTYVRTRADLLERRAGQVREQGLANCVFH